jgi:hypothetical protein
VLNDNAWPKTYFKHAVHRFDLKEFAYPSAALGIRARHDMAAQLAKDSAGAAERV